MYPSLLQSFEGPLLDSSHLHCTLRLHPPAPPTCSPAPRRFCVQDDGTGKYPSVLQSFEGPLLDWDDFAVRLTHRDIPTLPAILRALAANASAISAKRAALARQLG